MSNTMQSATLELPRTNPRGMPRGISIVAQPKPPDKRKQLLEMQAVLYRIVTGNIRQLDDKGFIIDVPAREIAMCAKAFRELEAHLMVMRGIAPLAPVKPEPKSKRRAVPQIAHSELPVHLQGGQTDGVKPAGATHSGTSPGDATDPPQA